MELGFGIQVAPTVATRATFLKAHHGSITDYETLDRVEKAITGTWA
jgi:hypothetical protein